MSKSQNSPQVALSHEAEYKIIKHDLIRIIALNAIYLIAILALYFTNQKTQYLDRILGHWFHF